MRFDPTTQGTISAGSLPKRSPPPSRPPLLAPVLTDFAFATRAQCVGPPLLP